MTEHDDTNPLASGPTRLVSFDEEYQEALIKANRREQWEHLELNPDRFHPSQIGYCERQIYLRKLGLQDLTDLLGIFRAGTAFHGDIKESLGESLTGVQFEVPNQLSTDGIVFTGRCDAYDAQGPAIYDFKTWASLNYLSAPYDRHLDQLTVYMAMFGVPYASIEYVDRADWTDFESWPAADDEYPTDFFRFNPGRFGEIRTRAAAVRDAIEAHGIARSEEEIPFEPCDCYFCEEESLAFHDLPMEYDPSEAEIEAFAKRGFDALQPNS